MRRLGYSLAIVVALVTGVLTAPASANSGECRWALGELTRDMDRQGARILGVGPISPPDRETELRMVIRSLAQAARNMHRSGDEEGCLEYVAQARDKLKQL